MLGAPDGRREALPASVEDAILEAWRQGDRDAATTATLRAYGSEIYGFLASLHRSEVDATEAFSLFCEGLWGSFERFEGAASVRTWAYAIARRSSLRVARDARRRSARQSALPESSSAWALQAQVRSATASFLATQKRTRIVALRETLPEADQALLMLRIDRGLAWSDLAIVLHDGESLDEGALKRESARLRKRFQLVKERLVELARREGLLP